MNYSLDALWWKLTDTTVRDLAALLTAPPLWHTAFELQIRELLGQHGFRYLLDLDNNPQPLHDYIAAHNNHKRLGLYAEHLLAFWFLHAPHTQLLTHNLAVRSDSITIGAADFVVLINDSAYHIELTCKYYGGTSGNIADLYGLNRNDRMKDKINKLPQQLMLLKFSDGIQALQQKGLPIILKPASIVRGMVFVPEHIKTFESPVNPYSWQGIYLDDLPAYAFHPTHRYASLDRMRYLSPARLPKQETQDAVQIQTTPSGLIAVLAQRPDGYWHEIHRLMKVSDDTDANTALKQTE